MDLCLQEMCVVKLHAVRVTDANLDYRGSVTIGRDILKAAGIPTGKMVQINNKRNAATWQTYTLPGEPGAIILNGPPAHLFKKNDEVFILSKILVGPEAAWRMQEPTSVYFDEQNRILRVDKHWRPDIPNWEGLSAADWDALYARLQTAPLNRNPT